NVAELAGQRDALRHERSARAQEAQTLRDEWRTRQEQAHGRELETNDLRHRRDALAERLREDYQVELAEVYRLWTAQATSPVQREAQTPGPPELAADQQPASPQAPDNLLSAIRSVQALDPAAVNEEIAELRRKLSRLGSVNLDSLQELNELETRSGSLQAQFT